MHCPVASPASTSLPVACTLVPCAVRRPQSVGASSQHNSVHSSTESHRQLSTWQIPYSSCLHVPHALPAQHRTQAQQAGAPQHTATQEEQDADLQQESTDSSLAAKIDRLSSHAAASTSGQQDASAAAASHENGGSASDSQVHDSQHESQWEFVGVYRSKGPSGRAKPPNQQARLNPSMWEERPRDGAAAADNELTVHLKPRRPKYQPREDPVKRDAMDTKVLELDKSFKPLKLIDPIEMRLNLELQGLEPLQHNRQVWKTETWALVQVGSHVPVRLADGRDVTGRAVLLPRLGPFVIGSAPQADCDLIIDSPGMAARPVRLELVHCGERGRVVRLTVSETGSGESVWVNRNRLPLSREIEARPHNIITIAHRDIAFQVVPLHSGDNLQWDLEVAQRLRLQLRDPQGNPRFDKRLQRRDVDHLVQLGNEERQSCMACPQPASKPPCCIARAFFRAAVSLQEQRAIEATAASQPDHSQAGRGQYAEKRSSSATKPYVALGGNPKEGPRLVRILGWWAKLELHLGNVASARRLWRRSVFIARKHPNGLVKGGGLSQLLAWARLEALNGEFPVADYLIGEALVAAPGDRRLHLVTGMIEDLKRLMAERQNTADVAWSPGEASAPGLRRGRTAMMRRRWATLPQAQRQQKKTTETSALPLSSSSRWYSV